MSPVCVVFQIASGGSHEWPLWIAFYNINCRTGIPRYMNTLVVLCMCMCKCFVTVCNPSFRLPRGRDFSWSNHSSRKVRVLPPYSTTCPDNILWLHGERAWYHYVVAGTPSVMGGELSVTCLRALRSQNVVVTRLWGAKLPVGVSLVTRLPWMVTISHAATHALPLRT